MSIQKEITIRSHSAGHVRFEIPEQLCNAGVARILTANILKFEGVYRVKIFSKQRKLSINYQISVCDLKLLAKQLHKLLADLDKQGFLVAKVIQEVDKKRRKSWNIKSKLSNWKATRWVSEKYSSAKETAHAAKVITKIGLKAPKPLIKDPEKAIIDFLNDILVLYLIKIHWTRITQEWLPRPWVHRYEWTAVFYLFYLLVRSRKPK
jgi:hypothetical protein